MPPAYRLGTFNDKERIHGNPRLHVHHRHQAGPDHRRRLHRGFGRQHLPSKTSTHGRNMAGARALWRATGMKDEDFKKPIIAIANSFTQFVPGHVHLKDLGQ